MGAFNWLDLLIILCLLVGMAIGYAQGLVRQLIGFAALYVALVLATQFFRILAQTVNQLLKLEPSTMMNAIAFFALLFVILTVVNVVAFDAYKTTRVRLVPFVDHISGIVLGLASMWVIVSVAVGVIDFAVKTQVWMQQAEATRTLLQLGLEGSVLAEVTATTLPTIVSTISPWLPNGLPALFNL